MMRIRFFNTYEPVSSLYRDLIPHLVRQGAEVEIIVSKAEYRRDRNLDRAFKNLPGVRIIRMPGLKLQVDSGFLAKGLLALLYLFSAAFYSLLSPRKAFNVFLAQPPLVPLLGWALSVLRGQPYICIVNDINTQTPIELGAASQDSLLASLLHKLTVFSWARAGALVAIGRCMVARIREMGVPEAKIRFIHQWANEEEIKPIRHSLNSVRNDFGFGRRFVLMYAGNIGIPQYFDDLLKSAEELKSRKDILFVIIGEGSRRNHVEGEIDRHQLSNVLLLPFLHGKYELSEILSAGDIHFVSLRNVWTGLGVPSKSYTVMASGRPIIYQGSLEGEIARMVCEEDIGKCVPQEDAQSLTDTILSYADDPLLTKAQGERARRVVETNLSRSDALEQYGDLILNWDARTGFQRSSASNR